MADGGIHTTLLGSRERVPTERQYATLLTLGSGSALLTGRKRDIDPLLHHRWVTADHGYAWVRITPHGLHALALAAARYGLPEMTHGSKASRVCSECGCGWRPRCRCGSRSWRYKTEEVTRARRRAPNAHVQQALPTEGAA